METIACPWCGGSVAKLPGGARDIRRCPHCSESFRQGESAEAIRAQLDAEEHVARGQVRCCSCGGWVSRQAWSCPQCGQQISVLPGCAAWSVVAVCLLILVPPFIMFLLMVFGVVSCTALGLSL